MSTIALATEKNELVRPILDVDDITILRKVKSMLNGAWLLAVCIVAVWLMFVLC